MSDAQHNLTLQDLWIVVGHGVAVFLEPFHIRWEFFRKKEELTKNIFDRSIVRASSMENM